MCKWVYTLDWFAIWFPHTEQKTVDCCQLLNVVKKCIMWPQWLCRISLKVSSQQQQSGAFSPTPEPCLTNKMQKKRKMPPIVPPTPWWWCFISAMGSWNCPSLLLLCRTGSYPKPFEYLDKSFAWSRLSCTGGYWRAFIWTTGKLGPAVQLYLPHEAILMHTQDDPTQDEHHICSESYKSQNDLLVLWTPSAGISRYRNSMNKLLSCY